MKTVACIVARNSSTRLPKKALLEINGKKLIEYLIEKIKLVKNVDSIYLCTSVDKIDRALLTIADNNNIKSYAGSRESVIDRMLHVAKIEKADNIVRITGDNVFTDELFLQMMIKLHSQNKSVDYTRTEYLPLGITGEVIKVASLKKIKGLIDASKSQYLMWYIFNPDIFKCQVLIPPTFLRAENCSLTVDTYQDFVRTKFIINKLYKKNKIKYQEILDLCKKGDVPNFYLNRSYPIKYSDNRTISFHEYRKIMDERIEKSVKVYLDDNLYYK